MKTEKKSLFTFVCLSAGAVLIFLDQITKYAAATRLKGNPPVILIPGVLELQYLENRGAAFGSLQGMQLFFWILTLAFLAAAVFFLIRIPKTRRYYPLIACCIVLTAGAAGNFIDRLLNQYVVDFIYFSIINFPIFNVADIYITLSFIGILLLVFFFYKDGDFDFLSRRKRTGNQEERERDPWTKKS